MVVLVVDSKNNGFSQKWFLGHMQYVYLIDFQPCACPVSRKSESHWIGAVKSEKTDHNKNFGKKIPAGRGNKLK